MNYICENISINEKGDLTFAGQDICDVAERYGTPVYLMDEDRIRHNCRVYTESFRKCFPEGSLPLYAGKANCFRQMYRIMQEENMGVDVVSCGEIHTVKSAGFGMGRAFFHGNNKTDADIRFAMDAGVGYFVVDNPEELAAVEAEAAGRGMTQKILLRITPGIDPHTYEAVNTGKVDSKFGNPIATGQAEEIVKMALAQPHIALEGFHCHVGSQVFGEDVFERAAAVMLEFIADMNKKFGYMAACLNLGGGYGVRYTADDPCLNIREKIEHVAECIKETCANLEIPVPQIFMEPGRSIVADAGMTLYTAGSVKKIPGYKNYVSIDGGMTDNPRFALYKSRYTCYNASRMNEEADMPVTIGGRCCESGDIIAENIPVPSSTCRGDIIAVCTTGAYNYSMASNYNRIPRPPVVMLNGAESYIAVKRETFDDITSLDV
ncbi:MAG: diaminopimelate decarboxylase [Lachnospiraceae bacterium]|nr:diaminopimelate decarboxylase [Lachnospiraceae bacterium]